MSAARRSFTASGSLARAAAFAPAALLCVASLAVAAACATPRGEDGRLAVIFPPWWSAEHSLAAASKVAAVTGVGGFAFVVGVAGAPNLSAARFREVGALAAVDGSRFPACFSLNSMRTR